MFRKELYTAFMVLFLFIGISGVFAAEYSSFKYVDFKLDNNSKTNKVSFEITDFETFQEGDLFKLNVYFNKVLIDDSCQVTLEVVGSTVYKKLTCEVQKKGSGEYTFIGMILRNGEELARDQVSIDVEQELRDVEIYYDLRPSKTLITINVNVEGENLEVQTRIPKEVITELTDANKDWLIHSELPYKILESDPLIAWEIAKAPTEINYTINKKISNEDIAKFDAQIAENKKTSNIASYVMYLLVIIIIMVVLSPLFFKKFKK